MPPPASQLLSLALAVALPAAVLAAAVLGLERFRNLDEQRELRNAGRIINGEVVEGDAAAEMDRRLAQTTPRVVLLGNSLVRADLQPPMLARRLGLPAEEVVRFGVPNSLGPHWFAILKNRVYGGGHAPELVIVLSDLQSLLAVEPRSESSYLNLAVQLAPDEPAIDRRVKRRSYTWDRVRENRSRLRDASMHAFRNLSVNLLWHAELATTEREETDLALAQVFDDALIDLTLHRSVIPTFDGFRRELTPWDPRNLPRPGSSFVLHITRLVAEHGGLAVFVRPPMSPDLPAGAGDVVRPGTEARLQALVERNGGLVLDLRHVPLGPGHFYNLDHMNDAGSTVFTWVVADILAARSALWRRAGAGAELEVLHRTGLYGDQVLRLPLDARFAHPPPPLPEADLPVDGDDDGATWFRAPALAALSDHRTEALSLVADRCSPVRVREDGAFLPRPHVLCLDAPDPGDGWQCHPDDRVLFASTDGSSPRTNGRRYDLALAPDRRCWGGLWLYPGDRATVALGAPTADVLPHGATEMRVDVVPMRVPLKGPGTLHVGLRRGAATVLTRTLPADTEGPRSWRFDTPLPPGTDPLALDLHNEGDSWLFLASVVLAGP